MSSCLALRAQHPLVISFPSLHRPSPKASLFSTISHTLALNLDPARIPRHGPTLRRAQPFPPPLPPDGSIDRESFTRSFDLAAVRVPASECSTLERRLRGHLLNWPRLRNVARVPGDDLDPDLKKLFRDPARDSGDRLRSLAKLVAGESEGDEKPPLSPVLYREKLVKDFNWRGFINFRNLAKISRPKKKKKKNARGEGLDVKERRKKNDFAVLELVEDGCDGEEEDMRGLLEEGFEVGRWRGPTRLLLLDERYARKRMEELPEAVKAVLQADCANSKLSIAELVQCRLTLFYDYWQMNELLEVLLPEGMVVPAGFETVGHIAHLNLRDEHLPYKKLIAQVVLDKNKPKIQTVVNKMDAIQNEFRAMQLELLAGNHSLVTTVIENGVRFQVDLATVYWNSRLGTERQRLLNHFTNSDVVCDVFSGVGPIAISAAKKVRHVFANDLNPIAVEYLERNVIVNKLERKIEVFNMDGRRFISSIFASQHPYPVTQVVMNLPNDAAEFLDVFRGIFLRRQKENKYPLPKIHVYGFSKAERPEFDFNERISMTLGETVAEMDMHRVRLVAPGKWMLCGSFILPENVAYAKQTAT